MPARGGEWVAWGHVVERLRAAEGYWLATVTPAGRPHAVPIWGVLVDDDLFLETGDMQTVKNRNLAVNRAVRIHLDGVNDVVIVRGHAHPYVPDPPLAARLAVAYSAKYPGYAPTPDAWNEGGLMLVEPDSVLAWGEIHTATRWQLGSSRDDPGGSHDGPPRSAPHRRGR